MLRQGHGPDHPGRGLTTRARRAGVSRGAQLHHFPTKAELVAAAVEHLLDRRIDEFRRAFAGFAPGTDRIRGSIDLLWSLFQGGAFTAWAELWVAGRTDPPLAEVMFEVDQRFDREARAIYSDIVAGGDEFAFDFVFTLMTGMAFERLVPGRDVRPASEYLDVLNLLATAFEIQES